MSKVSAEALRRAGCRYLGTAYKTMDCQKFWERALADCGLTMDLGGSNSWYRYMMQHGWCGTPEECVAKFGKIPPGATLFIREDVSSSTPEKFRHDGIGDITHMGIYTSLNGAEMAAIGREMGAPDPGCSNYGDGAIHSSSSRGGVCTSNFAGKTIPHGGWNRVGLYLDGIDYDGVEPTPGPSPSPEPEPTPEPTPEPETATVVSENGKAVNTRKGPDESYALSKAGKIPVGDTVGIVSRTTNSQGEEWYRVRWVDPRGAAWVCWIKGCFLRFDEPEPEPEPTPEPGKVYTVHIPHMAEYQAQALIRQYPGSWMTAEGTGVG